MFRSPLTDGLVVLVILLLIVGPKKLPQLGRGLGDGMREFKEGITGDHKHDDPGTVSLTKVETPATGAVADRPAQPAAAPRAENGSERGA